MYNKTKRCLKLQYYQHKATEFISDSNKTMGYFKPIYRENEKQRLYHPLHHCGRT